MLGKLYLIPTPIGESDHLGLPPTTIQHIHQLDTFIVERCKTARKVLKKIKTPVPFQEMTFFELNRHTDPSIISTFLEPALAGKSIGLLSEAGCPCIADPGADIVKIAHEKGIEVIPLVGASSILLALMASGMNGQSFTFHGYLPIKGGEKAKRLKGLEKTSKQFRQTQLFIETPYRNNAMLEDALKHLQPHTLFGVAADLLQPTQYIKTQKVQDWKKMKTLPDLHKRPAIFMLLA